jgi:basic membrane protein A
MMRGGHWMLGAVLTACSVFGFAPARADNPKMIIYVAPTPLGVNPFLIMGKTGTEAVAKKFGAKTRTYEPKDPTTRKQDIEAAVRDGADIIVVLGFEFGDIIPDVAAKNPKVKFLIVDQCVKDPGPNVFCSVFREYEGSYVAGAEAGLTSKTGKVGTIAALDIPFLHRYSDAFEDGAKAARPDVKISKMLVIGGENPFGDPVRAEQQTQAMIADGADRIYAAAAGGNGGVFKAAKEKGALAIGVDVNQCPQAPGAVLDNMEKRVDNALVQAVEGIVAGTQQHLVAYGLKEGGLSLTSLDDNLADSKCEIAKFPDVVKKAHEIAADIESGKITMADPMMNPRK